MSFTPKLWVENDVITAAELNRLEDAMEFVVSGPVVINARTASYTLALSDAGKLVTFNSNNALVCTVPTNASRAFPIGTVIAVAGLGTGGVTVAGAFGVTVLSFQGNLQLAGRYAVGALTKIGTDTWLASGFLV